MKLILARSQRIIIFSRFCTYLVLAGFASSNVVASESVLANAPAFSSEEVVLFEHNSNHPSVRIRSGDIVLRKDDAIAAIGTYPVPKSFREEMGKENTANWSFFQMTYEEAMKRIAEKLKMKPLAQVAKVDNLKSTQLAILDASVFFETQNELKPIDQQGIADEFKITPKRFRSMRGDFKPIVLDEFAPDSVEAEKHANLKDFIPNFYRYDFVKYFGLNQEDKLKALIHYYPGTPFVSHAGIISVEIENAKPHVYIYESIPQVDADPAKGIAFQPGGIYKSTLAQFFGPSNADYGVIVRPKFVDPELETQAAKAAWRHYEYFKENSPLENHFDERLDWRQDKSYYCSSYVWRAYLEGAHVDVISDLSMFLLPAWAIRMQGDGQYYHNLVIAPQSILLSTKVDRLVDFESNAFGAALIGMSDPVDPVPSPLPEDQERNPITGHRIYSVGDAPY